MSGPDVDVVIPLHRSERSVERAIASAAASAQGISTRVTVVLHNFTLDDALRERMDNRARILHCDDGMRSPSGPRNLGLAHATAPFVFFLDSDDELAPRCLKRLHNVAVCVGADVVLPSIRRGRRYVGTPLVLSRRPRVLDPVKHYLFLRSHVPALLRREMLLAYDISYPEGLRTGEDFAVMAKLFASVKTAMSFDAVYVVLDSGDERISVTPLPATEQLAAVRFVLESTWFGAMDCDLRQAVIRRVLSVNLAATWRRHSREARSSAAAEYAAVRNMATTEAPGILDLLSIRDRIDLRLSPQPTAMEQVLSSRIFGLVPSSCRGMTTRLGPLWTEIRGWLVRVLPRCSTCVTGNRALAARYRRETYVE